MPLVCRRAYVNCELAVLKFDLTVVILILIFVQVTLALSINCAVYGVFRLVQFGLFITANLMATPDGVRSQMQRNFTGTGFVFGALAVMFQGPIFLTMDTMRKAFKKTLHIG